MDVSEDEEPPPVELSSAKGSNKGDILHSQHPLWNRVSTKVLTFVKASIATQGGVIFWVGSWKALDVYLLPINLWVDIGCVIVGLLLLILTNTFQLQAGIAFTSRVSLQSCKVRCFCLMCLRG